MSTASQGIRRTTSTTTFQRSTSRPWRNARAKSRRSSSQTSALLRKSGIPSSRAARSRRPPKSKIAKCRIGCPASAPWTATTRVPTRMTPTHAAVGRTSNVRSSWHPTSLASLAPFLKRGRSATSSSAPWIASCPSGPLGRSAQRRARAASGARPVPSSPSRRTVESSATQWRKRKLATPARVTGIASWRIGRRGLRARWPAVRACRSENVRCWCPSEEKGCAPQRKIQIGSRTRSATPRLAWGTKSASLSRTWSFSLTAAAL
mmetsp:Transcript_111328/g.227977  ORF Transcript_111328/g.227977 Transcript_111328/m.227977 type:complete len:263 (+) Transcript_111328:1566-2354(+)